MATHSNLSRASLRPRTFGRLCDSHFGTRLVINSSSRRPLQSSAPPSTRVPDFAFAFDIDGVLVRGADPLPRAHKALSYLNSQHIPFILLTNGGGKPESKRAADLSECLDVPIDTKQFIQSHSPFSDFEHYKDKTVLIVGGERDECRHVAKLYGFKNVVLPVDIVVQHPEIWPFVTQYLPFYQTFAQPLPKPINPTDPSQSLKIDAIFVYHEPRDWAVDSVIILDLLLSHQGILGTHSSLNGRDDLPNRGYQQDGQPPLYFSNGDLLWPAKYHLPRLAQGGFREALEGVWAAVTGGPRKGIEMKKTVIGKPSAMTYAFAEKRLTDFRTGLVKGSEVGKLKNVYMVGDNPESDIKGGNDYDSPLGTKWNTLLVNTGVYQGGKPKYQPTAYVPDVYDAVEWGVEHSAWACG